MYFKVKVKFFEMDAELENNSFWKIFTIESTILNKRVSIDTILRALSKSITKSQLADVLVLGIDIVHLATSGVDELAKESPVSLLETQINDKTQTDEDIITIFTSCKDSIDILSCKKILKCGIRKYHSNLYYPKQDVNTNGDGDTDDSSKTKVINLSQINPSNHIINNIYQTFLKLNINEQEQSDKNDNDEIKMFDNDTENKSDKDDNYNDSNNIEEQEDDEDENNISNETGIGGVFEIRELAWSTFIFLNNKSLSKCAIVNKKWFCYIYQVSPIYSFDFFKFKESSLSVAKWGGVSFDKIGRVLLKYRNIKRMIIKTYISHCFNHWYIDCSEYFKYFTNIINLDMDLRRSWKGGLMSNFFRNFVNEILTNNKHQIKTLKLTMNNLISIDLEMDHYFPKLTDVYLTGVLSMPKDLNFGENVKFLEISTKPVATEDDVKKFEDFMSTIANSVEVLNIKSIAWKKGLAKQIHSAMAVVGSKFANLRDLTFGKCAFGVISTFVSNLPSYTSLSSLTLMRPSDINHETKDLRYALQ